MNAPPGDQSGRGGHHSATGPDAQATPVTANNTDGTSTSPEVQATAHPAQLALDAADPWVRASWRSALDVDIAAGWIFSTEETQERYGLADLGNGIGGMMMGLHRAGRIERVGYRPSRRLSRHGSVVAIWRGVAGR